MKEELEQAQSHIVRSYQTLGLFLLKSRVNPIDLDSAIVELDSARQCLEAVKQRIEKTKK